MGWGEELRGSGQQTWEALRPVGGGLTNWQRSPTASLAPIELEPITYCVRGG